MSLRQKTIVGLQWSFTDSFVSQATEITTGIILARLLSPREFGLVGMVTFVIAVSQSFIDSGFTEALVRKQDCTEEDFSTVFYYNLIVAVCLYAVLFAASNPIALFFHEPKLTQLVRIISFGLILGSFGVVQSAILQKNINFKLQTKVSIIASLLSGILSISMAYAGWGVWSLVWKSLSYTFLSSCCLWIWSMWRPLPVFSVRSFREMFGFGSKLMASGVLNTVFSNIYYVVIGKIFSSVELGYFTKAEQFQESPSRNIYQVIQRVSYPVLASLQGDTARLKRGYQELAKNAMFISCILMAGLAAVADSMVLTLIGEQWRQVVPYLRILCFSGALFPLQSLNLSILKVQGRSDLFLGIEVLKKSLVIPVVAAGYVFGMTTLVVGIAVSSVGAYFMNSYWSGKFIGYSMFQQIRDIAPSFGFAAAMGLVVWGAGQIVPLSGVPLLLAQICLGGLIVVGTGEVTRYDVYIQIRDIALRYIRQSHAPG